MSASQQEVQENETEKEYWSIADYLRCFTSLPIVVLTSSRDMTYQKRAVVAISAIVAGVLLAALLTYTLVISTKFPYSLVFNVEEIMGNVYVDKLADVSHRRDALQAIQYAHDQVRQQFGAVQSSPAWIVCVTESCYANAAGNGYRATTWGNFLIVISPSALNGHFFAHELSHAELGTRLTRRAQARIPAWFDEGLAVLVSNDPRYVSQSGGEVLASESELPVLYSDFKREIGVNYQKAYRAAYAKVAAWHLRSGPQGIEQLIDRINAGAEFDSAMAITVARPN